MSRQLSSEQTAHEAGKAEEAKGGAYWGGFWPHLMQGEPPAGLPLCDLDKVIFYWERLPCYYGGDDNEGGSGWYAAFEYGERAAHCIATSMRQRGLDGDALMAAHLVIVSRMADALQTLRKLARDPQTRDGLATASLADYLPEDKPLTRCEQHDLDNGLAALRKLKGRLEIGRAHV